MVKTKETIIPEKRWYKNTNALIGLAISTLTLLAAAINLLGPCTSENGAPPKKVKNNTQIVLDLSEAMAQNFGTQNRLEAAKAKILANLRTETSEQHNLSLRVFGGDDCNENSRIVVPFKQENESIIRTYLQQDFELRGKASLLSAIVEAVYGFDAEQFDGETNSVIVVSSGRQDCDPEDPHSFIAELREKTKVYIHLQEIRLVGVGTTDRESAFMQRIAAAIPAIDTYIAQNPHELGRVTGDQGKARAFGTAKELFFEGLRHFRKGEQDAASYDKALVLLKQAANDSIIDAMSYVGRIYAKGLGTTERDLKEAYYWYSTGAELNNEVCTNTVLSMHKELSENHDLAREWLRKAAEAGHAKAIAYLDSLENLE